VPSPTIRAARQREGAPARSSSSANNLAPALGRGFSTNPVLELNVSAGGSLQIVRPRPRKRHTRRPPIGAVLDHPSALNVSWTRRRESRPPQCRIF
jgi:hypothetical protein